MGKIYFNIKNAKINYLEEDYVSEFDILLSDMACKIILVSMNNIKEFDCVDYRKENKAVIKQLIQSGYKPANKLMEILITQNYCMCPLCGHDVDIEGETDVLIFDVGSSLANLVNNNVAIAKELMCEECAHQGIYYYDIYATDEENNAFVERAVSDGADIFVRYRYVIDRKNKFSYIPIIFDLNQLLAFFNKEEDMAIDDMLAEADFIKELNKNDDKKIISMLFNTELQEIFETEDNLLVNEMRVELKPVELGSYNKYNTKTDYELIKQYELIGDNQEQLLELILK